MIAVDRRTNADDAKRVTDVDTNIIAEDIEIEIEDDMVCDLDTDEVAAEAIDTSNGRTGDNTKDIHRII